MSSKKDLLHLEKESFHGEAVKNGIDSKTLTIKNLFKEKPTKPNFCNFRSSSNVFI